MTARLRHGAITAYTPATQYTLATVTVTLDGVDVDVVLTTAARPYGMVEGDIAWLGQDGRRLVWLGYYRPAAGPPPPPPPPPPPGDGTYGAWHDVGEDYAYWRDLGVTYDELRSTV